MLVRGRAHVAGGIRPGELIEVSEHMAELLIDAGLAESVETLAGRDPEIAAEMDAIERTEDVVGDDAV